MNFKEICELIDLVARKGIPLVEVEQAGVKVKIRGTEDVIIDTSQAQPARIAPVAAGPELQKTGREEPTDDADIVKSASPMVGTFYRAHSPDSDPLVDVGLLNRVQPHPHRLGVGGDVEGHRVGYRHVPAS